MKAFLLLVSSTFFFLLIFSSAGAQITVTNNNNAALLAQQLAGPGVSISNATLTGIPNSSGTFTSTAGCNLNMPSGIILTSGVATRAVGPNNFPAVGPILGEPIGPGDADIDAITGNSSLDACVLVFDVTVLSDSLQFKYVFGSDEYLEFIPFGFFDAFAFIISGPGITTQNLAVVPNTATPVAINTINPSTNSIYYVNNTPGACLEYDGFTTVLTAKIGGLTPCATYHIKLVVADILDELVDSGVFLLSNSFTSNLPSIDSLSLSASNTTDATEGCVNGTVTFSIPNSKPTPTVVTYTIGGTAINGTDYSAIGNSVTIPANATSATLNIQPTLDVLAEGTETVKLYLTNTCSATPYDSIILNIIDRSPFTTSNDTSVCLGATVQMSASAWAANYSWTPALEFTSASNIQSPSVAPTISRTYTASTTLGTCTFTDTVRINIIPTPFTVNAGPDINSCSGAPTQLTATPIGSAVPGNPFVYLWSPVGTLNNANISNPTVNAGVSGTYVIRLSSAECFDTDTVVVTQGTLNTTYAEQDVRCFNLANGSAAVTSVIGASPITYVWSNGAGNVSSISGLAPNTYTVTVSDNVGCTTSHNFVITQPAQLTTNIGGVFPLGCSGTGSATAVPSGGTSPYTYLWSTGATTATINSLPPGNTYTVTVTDDSLCTATSSFTIPSITAPTTSGTVTDVICNGASTGAINLTVTGTSNPYSFAWSNGAVTEDLSGIPAGTYYVTVTDINTCVVLDTFVVNQPATALTVTTNLIQNVLCFGGNTGAAYAVGNGGTGAITYAWSNGVSNDTVTNLSAGTIYTVTVTDANLCTATATRNVTEPAVLNASVAVVQNVSCFGGNNGIAFSTSAGGTTPYNYSWSNAVNNDTTTGLSAGNVYTVTITDANLCTATNTISVTQPLQLTVNTNLVQNVSCFGGSNGSAFALANNGTAPYNYAWSNGINNDTTINLSAGMVYTVTATDANSCTTSNTISVTQPLTLTVSTSVVQNATCAGVNNGIALATANNGTGPYTYNWSNGINNDTTIGLAPSTVYTVTAIDANGCTASNTISISAPVGLLVNPSVVQNVSCFGGNDGSATAVALNGTSPYTFSWSNAIVNDTTTALSAGTVYTVTATDANSCTASNTISVTEPTAVAANTFLIQNVSCFGANDGAVYATGTGGTGTYTYAWNNAVNNDTILSLTAGTIYTVTVSDANSCTATNTISVTQPAQLIVNTNLIQNVSCFGGNNGAAFATAAGGTGTINYAWSNSVNNDTTTGLSAGTVYTVTATDANSCTATNTISVTEPTQLTVNTFVINNVSCFGLSDGSAYAVASNGTAGYSYAWSNGINNDTTTSLSATTWYTVTATDANSCTASNTISVIQPLTLTVSTSVVQNATCAGVNNGIALATATDGTGPYTYNWSNGINNDTNTGLAPSTVYTVTAIDANGCTATNTISISAPVGMVVNPSLVQNVSCFGGNDGSATAIALNGTSPYTFSWSNAIVNDTTTGLTAGTIYTVTATDANNCTASNTISVTQPTAVIANVFNIRDVSCFNANDGAVYSTGTGGTGVFTFAWSNGINNDTITGLAAGTVYTVTVTDANGCTATNTISVTQPAQLTVNTNLIQNVSCFGGNNGAAFATAAGGAGTVNYAWSNSVNNDTTTGLTAGTVYTITVTDANSCTATNTISVTQPTQLAVNSFAINNVSCFGLSNGSAYAVANNGTAPYNFAWSNGINNDTTINLSAGTVYTVTATDANTCTVSNTINVTQPLALIVNTSVVQNVSCFGGSNGSAAAIANDGTAPYNFAWSNGVNNDTTINLSSGTVYTITVTDANGCTATNTISVTQPLALGVTTSVINNVSCFGGNNGSALAIASNGTSPYTFAWSNGVNNDTTTGLSAGTVYTVTAADANNCTATNTISVTEPAQFDVFISAIQNVLCNGQNNGSAFALGNGGVFPYSYAWSNGINDDTTTGLAPIIVYTVTATDANGCTATDNVSVIEPAALTVSVVGTNISCFGGNNGTATASANGGTNPYTYNWSGFTGNPYNSLPAGTYPVTVVDDNGCTTTDSVTLTQPARIEFDSIVVTNVSCFGGSDGTITVYNSGGTGAYGYTWNNGVAAVSNPTGLAQGFYSVTVNDANNCTRDTAVTITQPTQLLVSTAVLNNISCNGANDGSAVATDSGGTGPYTFTWSSGAVIDTAYSLAPGNVDVTITDANSCTATNNAFITEPNLLTTANVLGINYCATPAFGDDTIIAFGGTSPYTYSVSTAGSNNTGIFTNLLAANYTYTVTDDNGCIDTGSFVMPVVPADTYTQNNTNISCFGGNDGEIDVTADVAANGTYQFSLNNGVFQGIGTFSNLVANTYLLVAQNGFGCFDTLAITLTQPATVVSVNVSTTDAICNGDANGTALATGAGGVAGYSFVWSNGSVVDSAIALPAGQVDVTITDANGCTATASGTVNEPALLTLSATGTDVLCGGDANGTILATANGGVGGYGYSVTLDGVNFINSPNQSFSGLSAGTYTVLVNDNNSCVVTTTYTINEPPALTLQLNTVNPTCFNYNDGEITALANGGVPNLGSYNYTLETGISNNAGLFTGLGADIYTITATDSNNCSISDSIEVVQPDSMYITVTPDRAIINLGEQIDLEATSNYNGVTYVWNPGTVLTCADCDNPTFIGNNNQTLNIIGTDLNGCIATTTADVVVLPLYNVFTPNSFTPNGDAFNDYWSIFMKHPESVKSIEVEVFNRIGEKVFESYDIAFAWDGNYKGKPSPEGVYVYVLKLTWMDGYTSKIYKGTITLLR
jgi:gliding motility-associated-like protein